MSEGLIINPGEEKRLQQMPSQMEETESGLSVPKGTIQKDLRSMSNDDWKKVRRLVRMCGDNEWTPRFQCQKCESMVVPSETEKVLECSCTKWKLPGWQDMSLAINQEAAAAWDKKIKEAKEAMDAKASVPEEPARAPDSFVVESVGPAPEQGEGDRPGDDSEAGKEADTGDLRGDRAEHAPAVDE